MIVLGHHGSGCSHQPAVLKVNLIRRPAAKRLVRARGVVDSEASLQLGTRRRHSAFLCPRVNPHLFDATSQPRDKHVFEPMTVAIHSDAKTAVLEPADEILAGKLAARVDILDIRCAEAPQCFVQQTDTEFGGQVICGAVPISTGHQTDR